MKPESKFQRYDSKRVQVTQIKCVADSDEHRQLLSAIEALKSANGYAGTREVFVQSVLAAAENLQD